MIADTYTVELAMINQQTGADRAFDMFWTLLTGQPGIFPSPWVTHWGFVNQIPTEDAAPVFRGPAWDHFELVLRFFGTLDVWKPQLWCVYIIYIYIYTLFTYIYIYTHIVFNIIYRTLNIIYILITNILYLQSMYSTVVYMFSLGSPSWEPSYCTAELHQ